jgi:NAD(P)-dependent dehydrogenase (short-subunit alcohol dehydrogenase family)
MTGTDRGGRDGAARALGHPALGDGPLLQGRCVVLTGAGGGIGRAMAEAFVCAGATLAATDIAQGPLDDLMAEIEPHVVALGVEPPFARAFDAAEPTAFEAFVGEVVARERRVDGLVNCAGSWLAAPYAEIDPRTFMLSVDRNLTTAFNGCRAVLPIMTGQRSGSVVNVASTAGEFGSITPASHYAAAKAGVIGLTKSLAREVGEFGVRVNALSPGPTDTVALGADTPEKKAAAGARTLFRRLGRPEEIAYCAVFLLSDLSTFVTGHVLGVNGGSRL